MAEKQEDSPYDSEHLLPAVRRTPDIQKNSPRMLRKAKVLPSPTASALATSSLTPEPSPKVPRELVPKDTQFPGTEFSMTSKKTHLDTSKYSLSMTLHDVIASLAYDNLCTCFMLHSSLQVLGY